MEHKLNRLSGSIQHNLALNVLASPQRSLLTALATVVAPAVVGAVLAVGR